MSDIKAAVEKELKRFSSIVEQHVFHLQEAQENLDIHPLPLWNSSKDIIGIQITTFDQINIKDLIKSENLPLNRTVRVLLSVCREMFNLYEDAEENFFIPLVLYGQSENCKVLDCTFEETFSKILPVIDQVSCFIQQVERVSWNSIQQLNSLYSEMRSSSNIQAGKAHFHVVFEHLGKVLSALIVLDEIFSHNSKLHQHFLLYKKLVHATIRDSNSIYNNGKDLICLENLLNDIEKKVFTISILKTVLQNLSQLCLGSICSNNTLKDEMQTVILGWNSQIEDVGSDNFSTETEKHVVSLTALSLCYQFIFDAQDRKVCKELSLLFKKIPCNTICIGHIWFGEKYIESKFLSIFQLFDRKGIDAIVLHRKNYLTTKIRTIYNDVQIASIKVLGWSSQMEAASKKPAKQFKKQDLSIRISTILKGLKMSTNLKYVAESLLGLHTSGGQPMGKTCLLSFCRLLEVIKAIEHIYHINSSLLIDSLPHLRQYFSFQVLTLIKNTKSKLANERKLDNQNLDVLAALSLAEQSLAGNATLERRLLTRICLSLALQNNIISEDSNLSSLLKNIELANDIQNKIRNSTSTEFLYFHQVIFKFYLQNYFDNFPSCSHRIHYMLAALADSSKLLERPRSLSNRKFLLQSLQEKTEETLKTEFLDKMCKSVEIELRLSTHKHLQLDNRNPFEKPLKLLQPITQIEPLNVFGCMYNVKDYIEQYLEKTFYSLTVLAPHNCSTYEKMRNSASQILGLSTIPSYLPSHTLDQGVDVLEIMRNINVFVQNYQYNLNQQFFVEFESNSKHLNTVSINHISNSIRTHGTGIINTTVNFTYQFLKKKFHILSQFLYDEHIKSRLLKDLQHWRQLKVTEKYFPYERAMKLHKGIRRLGLTNDGLTYLDQCRKLVTHIGNAIGYIRLVRSGGLHCISTSTQFIPELRDITSYCELSKAASVSEDTQIAAQNLDAVLKNLNSHFHQDTDYFKIMVDVFSVLRESKNSHLKNFYLLVPALTINFIEYFLVVKEQLQKKSKSTITSFTDDGFAMGLAYILKVLDQSSEFESFHWWSGVRRKFISEQEKIQQECDGAKGGDTKLQETLSLTLTRQQQQLREFELLFLGVSSATVFFKGSNNLADDEEEK